MNIVLRLPITVDNYNDSSKIQRISFANEVLIALIKSFFTQDKSAQKRVSSNEYSLVERLLKW